MVKLLLIGLGLFVFSCDSSSPTEVTTEVLVDSVCGNDEFEYLTGYGSGCVDPSTSYTGEDLASLYCGLAGYSSYVQFDVITDPLFTAEGTFALYGSPANDDIQEATCSDFGWFGSFGVTEYCPVIYNLVCE